MKMNENSASRYEPRFSYTNEIVNDLMAIEGACRLVDVLALPPDAAFRLKYEARRCATRYSTAIEGNTLTLDEIIGGMASSDRDLSDQQQEARNYWNALEWLERQVEDGARLTEDFVQRLHGIIIVRGRGRRAERSHYRTEECPVVDSVTGQVDYGPPRPEDVPGLVAALVEWRNSPAAKQLPGPIRAGILAYQFVTIHPFADGNGRTARALATAELWFSGYQMRGFLSVEEHYFQNLQRYYDSLQMGLDWDYYCGRNGPDLTPWLSYFAETLAKAASAVRDQSAAMQDANCRPATPWEGLNRRQQQLLSRLLLADRTAETIPSFSASDVAEWFMVSRQTAHAWLAEWRTGGLIEPASGAERVRSWRLNDEFNRLVNAQRKTTHLRE